MRPRTTGSTPGAKSSGSNPAIMTSRRFWRRNGATGWALSAPATLAVIGFLIVPIAAVIAGTFMDPRGAFAPYIAYFNSGFRTTVLFRTLQICGVHDDHLPDLRLHDRLCGVARARKAEEPAHRGGGVSAADRRRGPRLRLAHHPGPQRHSQPDPAVARHRQRAARDALHARGRHRRHGLSLRAADGSLPRRRAGEHPQGCAAGLLVARRVARWRRSGRCCCRSPCLA